jgi:hypothetical protein
MKKTIARNIAIVSAIFVVAFSTMLITNYFQVRSSGLLQTEAIESLKQLNDDGAVNPELKIQIRELDLLARKAYFISHERLMAGVYILLGMVIVLVFSLRFYYDKARNIPDKEIDPIDDWAIKTSSRRYVQWIGGGLVVAALGFAAMTSPWLRTLKAGTSGQVMLAEAPDFSENTESESYTDLSSEVVPASESGAVEVRQPEASDSSTAAETEAIPAIEISRVTHNSFRGNNSLGISAARNVPTSWDLASGKNMLWRQPVKRQGFNSPVINGNKVFITGADAEARELYCYELSSGELLWTLSANNIPGSPAQMPKTTNDTGLAAPSVTTNGQQVCAIFATGDLVCADMDGKQLWVKNIGRENSFIKR